MRAGNTGDTEDSTDEDALAQVREGEPASFGSGNFERSEFIDKPMQQRDQFIIFNLIKNIIKIEFKS